MGLDLNSVVVQGNGQTHAELDGDVVMMDIDRGDYYGLAGVAVRVWGAIVQPCSVAEICEILLSEYEVDRSACEADVLRFLTEMSEKRLIEVLAP